jgi:hypothetical protein
MTSKVGIHVGNVSSVSTGAEQRGIDNNNVGEGT